MLGKGNMTTEELRRKFNETFGIDNWWPTFYEVDAETYGNVCNDIINHLINDIKLYMEWDNLDKRVSISVGPNNGIMYKNVELILKRKVEGGNAERNN